jgi:LPS export ABC transporter protein LptC
LFSIKRSANNYEISQFIRKLYYKLVPFILSFFFITIFFWPSIYTTYDIKKPVLENQEKTQKYTFQGIDEFNQPFFLQAKKYQKIINNENKLLFEKPNAEINLRNGKWLTMIANEGIFDIEKQTLELMGDVLFLHSDGQQIDTNNAVIDLKKAIIYGNKKIFGKNETINFSSEGFKVVKTGKIFQLLGKSKIKIKNIK